MKCKPVQWMGILVLIVIFGGCALATKTNVDSHSAFHESLQKLIDKQEILELLYKYSYSWDSKNPDGLAEVFTKDASWEWWGRGAEKPGVVYKPRKNFISFASDRFKTTLADRQTRHYQTNTVFIELGKNRARTRTMILVTHAVYGQKGPKTPAHTGMFEDEILKTENGWRISRRVLRGD